MAVKEVTELQCGKTYIAEKTRAVSAKYSLPLSHCRLTCAGDPLFGGGAHVESTAFWPLLPRQKQPVYGIYYAEQDAAVNVH